ncbi:29844_t:CDS:2, partial [Racocetra persica]
ELDIQIWSKISFSPPTFDNSLIIDMATSLCAETSAATAQRLCQPNIIYNSEKYYDDQFLTVYLDSSTLYIYDAWVEKEKEAKDQIVVSDPEAVLILPLHNIVVDNLYESNNYQDKYEDHYLYQRAEQTYTHGYQKLLILLWNH